ncbi:MAG TPA: hypothetical protein P5136_00130 [Methanofastidiosum sp.]|nr:hypothetical protein [Methanofastidiosum sp.]
MFRYPFNSYGWFDFVFTYIKKPWWNLKLIFKAGFPFVPWDISESLLEFLFIQFKEYYGHYKDTRYGDNEISSWEEEYDRSYREGMSKKERESFRKMINERIQAFVDFKDIYNYITVARAENQRMLDNLTTEMFKDSKIRWQPVSENLSEMKEDGVVHNFKVNWCFNDSGLASILYEEVKERDHSIHDFEAALIQKDEEMAIKIIKYRNYLWD